MRERKQQVFSFKLLTSEIRLPIFAKPTAKSIPHVFTFNATRQVKLGGETKTICQPVYQKCTLKTKRKSKITLESLDVFRDYDVIVNTLTINSKPDGFSFVTRVEFLLFLFVMLHVIICKLLSHYITAPVYIIYHNQFTTMLVPGYI